MDQTTHRLPQGFVWPTVGHPGQAPLWALVPTPKQPRTFFDEAELKTLAETMRPENGGQQREIITVRELTKDEKKLWSPARYMIKSGERRYRSAGLAGLETVEIRIKEYPSVAEEKLDTFMLNEGRVGLSDIENAEAIADIMQEFGLTTQDELATKIGKSSFWVSSHLALLKLSPKARALMSPEIAAIERLKREVGVFLSRLSFKTQDDFAERMPKGRATAAQQLKWMTEELKGTPEEPEPVKHQPYVIRRVIGYFADQVQRRVGQLSSFDGFDRIFENSEPGQVLELLGRIKDVQAEFNELVTRIEELSKPFDSKKSTAIPTRPHQQNTSVQKFMQARAQQAEAAIVLKPTQAEEGDDEPPSSVVKKRPVTAAPFPPKIAFKPVNHGGEKTVQAEDSNGRIGLTKVNARQYVELWKAKQLDFQIKKKPKPDHYPTLEQAERGEGFD